MAGRSSSILTAKMVLLMASLSIVLEISTVEALSITEILGKSSAFSPLNLYLPSPALISIANVVVSTENATGLLVKVFRVSIKILYCIATRPSSLASIGKEVTMLVCMSVADIVNRLSLISNKKYSKFGRTVLVLDAPLMACRCFSNSDVDTMNLISGLYKFYMQYYVKTIRFFQRIAD